MKFLVLIGGVFAVVWAYQAWFHPFQPCPRCKGAGRNPGSKTGRWGNCRRCKGSGRIQVRGSRLLHQLVLSVMARLRSRKGD